MRRAEPMVFFGPELDERAAFGMPPSGDVIVLEISGSEDADEQIRKALVGAATVFGPAARRGVERWLNQGPDLAPAKRALREVVARQRDRGAKVRVDVDPRDL